MSKLQGNATKTVRYDQEMLELSLVPDSLHANCLLCKLRERHDSSTYKKVVRPCRIVYVMCKDVNGEVFYQKYFGLVA